MVLTIFLFALAYHTGRRSSTLGTLLFASISQAKSLLYAERIPIGN